MRPSAWSTRRDLVDTTEWSLDIDLARSLPSTIAASPIIDFGRASSPRPWLRCRRSCRAAVEPSMRLPAPIETFGPIVDAASVTSSSMYTGSIDLHAGRNRRRPPRAALLEHRAIRLEQRALLARVVPAFDVDRP